MAYKSEIRKELSLSFLLIFLEGKTAFRQRTALAAAAGGGGGLAPRNEDVSRQSSFKCRDVMRSGLRGRPVMKICREHIKRPQDYLIKVSMGTYFEFLDGDTARAPRAPRPRAGAICRSVKPAAPRRPRVTYCNRYQNNYFRRTNELTNHQRVGSVDALSTRKVRGVTGALPAPWAGVLYLMEWVIVALTHWTLCVYRSSAVEPAATAKSARAGLSAPRSISSQSHGTGAGRCTVHFASQRIDVDLFEMR
ncbi:hypothetical protein EVAR_20737_1 [Eumeta japonica]|uniref:Uncharacterized protein n=1 Tax=Eumeta variegata TaxID=151549 RepID=A0A4C1VBN7_EUMVA|nr:hypothetical protein EVAR_20737_1 [Eumeta japonica]